MTRLMSHQVTCTQRKRAAVSAAAANEVVKRSRRVLATAADAPLGQDKAAAGRSDRVCIRAPVCLPPGLCCTKQAEGQSAANVQPSLGQPASQSVVINIGPRDGDACRPCSSIRQRATSDIWSITLAARQVDIAPAACRNVRPCRAEFGQCRRRPRCGSAGGTIVGRHPTSVCWPGRLMKRSAGFRSVPESLRAAAGAGRRWCVL
jgi:hypothetical protein